MSEPRKNHLDIDGAQVKEEEHVSSYKPILESDSEFRSSKSNLSKSKEKLSSDGAEEKLLQKEDEAKITTRVDMADAKYVVGDHRNGDAKIELDANKRQFSGLTKEELMKYADDPFWVRLRWFMFVLFWALWLCMLAGAIAIIVKAPKCAPPPAKTWFEVGPLADRSSVDYAQLEEELPELEAAMVQGVFINGCEDTYEVLDSPNCIDQFKSFLEKAKKHSIKLIVDLTANFVSKEHVWFQHSENRSDEYSDYFIWAVGKNTDPKTGLLEPPNNWISTQNEQAWTWSDKRKEYYLHQYGSNQPDLNFAKQEVVGHFDSVLKMWMAAGASGIRLLKARQLAVNASLKDERLDSGRGSSPGADHTEYASLRHDYTSDQPQLDSLFAHWSHLVATSTSDDTVFTIAEDGKLLRVEWYRLERNTSSLRPPSAAPVTVTDDVDAVADRINSSLGRWPAVQLVAPSSGNTEVTKLAMLLPAVPVLGADQLASESNDTADSESFAQLAALRLDASIQHGHHVLAAVPAANTTDRLLACVRWKTGHTGYAAVYNPSQTEAYANLTEVQSLPSSLTVHHMSRHVKDYTGYTKNGAVDVDKVLVPSMSTIVLSYVPKSTAEQ